MGSYLFDHWVELCYILVQVKFILSVGRFDIVSLLRMHSLSSLKGQNWKQWRFWLIIASEAIKSSQISCHTSSMY